MVASSRTSTIPIRQQALAIAWSGYVEATNGRPRTAGFIKWVSLEKPEMLFLVSAAELIAFAEKQMSMERLQDEGL